MGRNSEAVVEQRVLHGDAFKQRWASLDRSKRRQLQRTATLGEPAGNAGDAALVAGWAWRQLRRLPFYIAALFAVALVFELLTALGGGGDSPSLALFMLAGMVSFSRLVRRYSAALLLNTERGAKIKKRGAPGRS